MKASIAFAIRPRAIPLVINLPCNALIVRNIIAKIVLVNEIFSRVVRWIDIYHFHLAMIALLQEFQDFEVVALDIEVLGRVPVLALLLARAQRTGRGRLRETERLALAVPAEAVALFLIVHIIAQQLAQDVEIDLAFLEGFGKKLLHRRQIFLLDIHGFPRHLFHHSLEVSIMPP